MKISLSLTHDCNLRCKYCYAGEKFHKTMELTTAKKIIDFAVMVALKNEPIDFSFFGGEPLLCMTLIKKIIAYIQTKNILNPISYSITSNGTLINDEIIDFIIEHDITLSISIDGSASVHNKNRVDINGKGTLETVLKNIKKVSNRVRFFQVNAVYGSETIEELDKTFSFLVENGIRNIHLNPNITEEWNLSSFPKITKAYEDLAEKYIQLYNNHEEVALNLIDNKIILFLKGGYEERDKCKMGDKEFGFAPSGNVYPCERLIGDDTNQDLCLGNIHTGIHSLRRCGIAKKQTNRNEECISCPVQKYCMNWCGCTNYNMTGHSDKVGAMLCHSERAVITVAKKVFTVLQNNETYLKHFLNYAYNHNKTLNQEVHYAHN